MSEPKKDLTQAQIESILREQFDKTQVWQNFTVFMVVAVPMILLLLMGFGDVHIAIRIAVYVVLGITLWKCEEWIVDRRVRKTIEAMKAV